MIVGLVETCTLSIFVMMISQSIFKKQVAVIKEAMATKVQNGKYAHVPIIANGNITCWQDCVDNLKETQTDGKKTLIICSNIIFNSPPSLSPFFQMHL